MHSNLWRLISSIASGRTEPPGLYLAWKMMRGRVVASRCRDTIASGKLAPLAPLCRERKAVALMGNTVQHVLGADAGVPVRRPSGAMEIYK